MAASPPSICTKGDIAWQVAHGETPDAIRNHPALKGLKIPRTGQPGILGPLATKIAGDLRRVPDSITTETGRARRDAARL